MRAFAARLAQRDAAVSDTAGQAGSGQGPAVIPEADELLSMVREAIDARLLSHDVPLEPGELSLTVAADVLELFEEASESEEQFLDLQHLVPQAFDLILNELLGNGCCLRDRYLPQSEGSGWHGVLVLSRWAFLSQGNS